MKAFPPLLEGNSMSENIIDEVPYAYACVPPMTVFPREFRWTMNYDLCKELTHFTTLCSVNLIQKKLSVSIMEAILGDIYNPTLEFVQNWITHNLNDCIDTKFELRMYDRCIGRKLRIIE